MMDLLDQWYIEFKESVRSVLDAFKNPDNNSGMVYYTERELEEDEADGIAATVAATMNENRRANGPCVQCKHTKFAHSLSAYSLCGSVHCGCQAYINPVPVSILAFSTELRNITLFFIEDYSSELINDM